MQQDQVEVAFCDFCGTSVPEVDFAAGSAVRLQGKTVGSCCLNQLRASAPVPVASAPPRPSTHDPRLVPVAIALLAALAAATIFLDYQLAGLERRRAQAQDKLEQGMRTDHEAIQRIDVAMDGTARRADLDGFADKLNASLAMGQQDAAQAREQLEAMGRDVAVVQRDVRGMAAGAVDYRPLFDDLRQQLQRQAAAIAEIRSVPAPVPVAPVEAATPPPSEEGGAGGGNADALPPALAEHARKLQSTDPAVRFEAVDELLRAKNAAALPHLLPLAKDTDSFVRRLTIEGLKGWKRPEVVEALLTALGDGDDLVRDTAWRSLREVTGQKLPFESTAAKDVRARAQQRWQEWWDKNKATFGS